MVQQLYEWEIRCEARREGYEQGFKEGRDEMLNIIIDFLKSKGISNEEINDFRNFVLKSTEESKS